MSSQETLAILRAYEIAVKASWSDLHPTFGARAKKWPSMDAQQLEQELKDLVRETEQPGKGVRVFWKMGTDYVYGGCNVHFANDGGLKTAAELVGKNDFWDKLAWYPQSAKYRMDDRSVVETGTPKLNFMERQQNASTGTVIYVLTSKVPIILEDGKRIGMFGSYAILDADAAQKVMLDKKR